MSWVSNSIEMNEWLVTESSARPGQLSPTVTRYLLEELLQDGGDVVREVFGEVHLLLLSLEGLAELLDARFGPADAVHPL